MVVLFLGSAILKSSSSQKNPKPLLKSPFNFHATEISWDIFLSPCSGTENNKELWSMKTAKGTSVLKPCVFLLWFLSVCSDFMTHKKISPHFQNWYTFTIHTSNKLWTRCACLNIAGRYILTIIYVMRKKLCSSTAKLFQEATFFIIIFTYLKVSIKLHNEHGVLSMLVTCLNAWK